MRTALASLLATAVFVSVAQAQTPAAPQAPAAQPAAPAPTTAAPATTAPATTAPATTAPATPTPPTPDASAPPAAPAAPAADAAPPPPPTLPTSGDGAQILSLIEKFCVPLVHGGNFEQLAKANGMKNNRRDNTWSIQLGTTNKDYSVTFSAPGINKDVCRGEVHYAVNQDAPITTAINIWSFVHQPELVLQANYVAVDPDGVKRVRKSWEHFNSAASTAVNFSTWTKPDDTSLNAKYSTGEIYYQERKLG